MEYGETRKRIFYKRKEEKMGFQSKPFYFQVSGDYALFTDPSTKAGGEKFTYELPTYQALKGIAESIFWKPTIILVIDSVKIMNPVKTETMGIRALMGNGNADLNYYTYLRDVKYWVKFHFEWNLNRPDLHSDRNESKHTAMISRSILKGGRRDVFLGTRECMAYIEPISEDVNVREDEAFDRADTPYDGRKTSKGLYFHSFTYPGEREDGGEKDTLVVNYSNIIMDNGRIDFPRPEDCVIRNKISSYNIKEFNMDNIKSINQELEESFPLRNEGGEKT